MKRFPILGDGRERLRVGDADPPLRSLPWESVEPYRESCLAIHDQTLERLAERGGLSIEELWAHYAAPATVRSRDWWGMLRSPEKTPDEIRAWLRRCGAT